MEARSSTIASAGAEVPLQDMVRGERGRALRAQLASWHPECSAEEIAEAIQTACKRFLEHAEGITEPGQIYSWIRTTAHRVLQREDERHGREEPRKEVDGLAGLAAEEPGPAEELISSEDDADLAELVEEVYSSLPDRGRDILALYSAGYKRPQAPAALYEADLGPVQRGEPGELILGEARVVPSVKEVPAEPLGYLLISEPAAHQIS